MTIFTKVDYSLASVVDHIEMGAIGLPDIQRPFVWKNAKVRNLFDSMYRGFPIGYLLFWEPNPMEGGRTIGVDQRQLSPRYLIVDGQQRLTSIYAVIKGKPVVRVNYAKELIEIAFNPLEEKFEVADAAIKRDKLFIPNISKLWSKDSDIFKIVDEYIGGLSEGREISEEENKRVKTSIQKLNNLMSFPFTALTLSSSVNEEQASEIFVRINSEGKKLNQSDFILTLMSVFWDKGRAELEDFSRKSREPSTGRASPFNYFIYPEPDHLLRVSVGVGFRRAKLSTIYSILRGKDLETEKYSAEQREKQFDILKEAQARVINLQYWHDFLKCLILAGYRSDKMISSQNAILFSYVLYLLGRTEYAIDEKPLRDVIAQWFFMSSLTGRYSTSPESKMEFDLARLRQIKSAEEFINLLHRVCSETLTQDYWNISLPNELATSAARSPSMFAYFASLNLLNAKALFSKNTVSDLLDPGIHAHRSAIERHHIFPKDYLKSIKIEDKRDINQIANFTFVEWADNSDISNEFPAEYYPKYSRGFIGEELAKMHYWHALPENWQKLDYFQFLQQRRELMTKVISDAYSKLVDNEVPKPSNIGKVSLDAIIDEGETTNIEFKSSLRMNLHTKQFDPKIEMSALKTISGFLNTHGGTLVIGVADDGEVIGVEIDKFPNEDKMAQHLVNLIKDKMALHHMFYIHPRFEDRDDARVMIVECKKSKAPIYVKDGNSEKFFIRTGPATHELLASEIQAYIKHRF